MKMGDFIPFNSGAGKKTNNANIQQSNQNSSKMCANTNLKLSGMPAFGSPAISYGGTQVQFGSPALPNTNNTKFSPNPRFTNQQYTPRGMNNNKSPRAQFNNSYSPRGQNSYSPRGQNSYSPRGQNSYSPRGQNSYSPRSQNVYSPRHQGSYSPRHQTSFQYTPSPCNMRKDSSEPNNFKTPHQHSPGPGRGMGRKSISRQFDKTPRFDPNSNAGGSANIEDYYNPSMLRDPWLNLCPVLADPR